MLLILDDSLTIAEMVLWIGADKIQLVVDGAHSN